MLNTSVSWNWNGKDSKVRLWQQLAGRQDLRPLSFYVESQITKNTESISSSKWLSERFSILGYFPMDMKDPVTAK